MANPEDENIDFEELNLPGEGLFQPEPSEEPTLSDDEEDAEDAADAADAAAQTDEGEAESESKEKKKKKRGRWGRKAKRKDKGEDLGRREIDERRGKRDDEKKSRGLVEAITRAEPYTVMLAIALLAIVIAVSCLLLELWRYGFDIKAKTAIAPASQSGLASTSAAAWPIEVQLTSSAAELEEEIGSPRIT